MLVTFLTALCVIVANIQSREIDLTSHLCTTNYCDSMCELLFLFTWSFLSGRVHEVRIEVFGVLNKFVLKQYFWEKKAESLFF